MKWYFVQKIDVDFRDSCALDIVGNGVRPLPFLFYPHPFYKGTLDTENSGPPPF